MNIIKKNIICILLFIYLQLFLLNNLKLVAQDNTSTEVSPHKPWVLGGTVSYEIAPLDKDFILPTNNELTKILADSSSNDKYQGAQSTNFKFGLCLTRYFPYEDDENALGIIASINYQRRNLNLEAKPVYWVRNQDPDNHQLLELHTKATIQASFDLFSLDIYGINRIEIFPEYFPPLKLLLGGGISMAYLQAAGGTYKEVIEDAKVCYYNAEKDTIEYCSVNPNYEARFKNGQGSIAINSDDAMFSKLMVVSNFRFSVLGSIGFEYYFYADSEVEFGIRTEAKFFVDLFAKNYEKESSRAIFHFNPGITLLYVLPF
jgi:hypothetical protein